MSLYPMFPVQPIEIAVMILATYRIAYAITSEDGPFGILEWIRTFLGAYELNALDIPTTRLGQLISCPLCVGMWLSIFVTFAYLFAPYGPIVVLVFGIAGGQHIINLLIILYGNRS